MSPDPEQKNPFQKIDGEGQRHNALETIFLEPRGIRAGWRAAVYVALFFLFRTILQRAEALLGIFDFSMTPGALFAQEIIAAASAIAAALTMSRIEGRRFGEYGMPWRYALRGRFWQGAFWGIAGISAVMLLMRALGGYSFGGLALHRGELARYALLWAGLFFVVGVYEEFFFRGYLQFTLAEGVHFWPAALATSVAFGAVHLSNPGEGPIGVLAVFVVGMFLCLTLQRTGQLWFAIGWHAAWDFGETYIYSVPDSGIVLPGHLLAASFHGPAWLTGGPIGPEGSVLAFAVMALMCVVFDRVYRFQSS